MFEALTNVSSTLRANMQKKVVAYFAIAVRAIARHQRWNTMNSHAERSCEYLLVVPSFGGLCIGSITCTPYSV